MPIDNDIDRPLDMPQQRVVWRGLGAGRSTRAMKYAGMHVPTSDGIGRPRMVGVTRRPIEEYGEVVLAAGCPFGIGIDGHGNGIQFRGEVLKRAPRIVLEGWKKRTNSI